MTIVIIINRQMLVLIHNGHKLDIRDIIHDTCSGYTINFYVTYEK
jgi:hypothetical protein